MDDFNFPKLKRELINFIDDQEGNVTRNKILTIGSLIILLSVLTTDAYAGHRSHSSHSSHSSTSYHRSHVSHTSSRGSHSNRSLHGSHNSHTSHNNTHSSHASHSNTHSSHASHSNVVHTPAPTHTPTPVSYTQMTLPT
ncbi:MAG: zinc transporter 7, partial [Lachnospiraceae bacterium]|nr:zinc transporter 7 [Lachnospiraceae bacterium]